jgi:hypothetical protein
VRCEARVGCHCCCSHSNSLQPLITAVIERVIVSDKYGWVDVSRSVQLTGRCKTCVGFCVRHDPKVTRSVSHHPLACRASLGSLALMAGP